MMANFETSNNNNYPHCKVCDRVLYAVYVNCTKCGEPVCADHYVLDKMGKKICNECQTCVKDGAVNEKTSGK